MIERLFTETYVDGNIFLQANVLKSSKASLVYNELGYG